jgi:transketolase C-terminal domain/subunit
VENKKQGYSNPDGKMVIEPEFDDVVQLFENGRAIVVKDGKEITISKTGRPVN